MFSVSSQILRTYLLVFLAVPVVPPSCCLRLAPLPFPLVPGTRLPWKEKHHNRMSSIDMTGESVLIPLGIFELQQGQMGSRWEAEFHCSKKKTVYVLFTSWPILTWESKMVF